MTGGRRHDEVSTGHPARPDAETITRLRAANEQLRNLLTAMFESTDAMIAVVGGDLTVIATNSMFATHFHAGDDPAGSTIASLRASQVDDTRREVLDALASAALSGEEVRLFANLHLHPFDRWFDVLAVPLRVQPGAMLRARDVTTLVEAVRARGATTAGSSEASVEEAVVALLDGGVPTPCIAVVSVDQSAVLQRALGPTVATELAHQVEDAVARVLPPSAVLLTNDGDTMHVVFDPSEVGPDEDSVVDLVSARLRDAVRQPVTLGGRTVRITASVGSATAGGRADVGAAVRRAAQAMQEARRRGGNRTVLASDESGDSHESTVRLWNALRSALQYRQMEAWFQPVVRLSDDRPVAVEALARWHHPGFGDIAPGEFIPLAERNSEILQIGSFVHSRAAEVMAFLRTTRSLRLGDFHVHVNASANELAWPSFASNMLERLASHGMRPEWFSVEIGERVLLQPDPAVRANVLTLAEAGVSVGLDDFGTGATSFASLTELPLHRIKIDRRFVAGMLDQPRTHRIVAAMITMATDLGIDTVAAGVETVEQADALRALGCRSAQGYLFAPAVPEAELVTVLGDMITIAETRSSTR